MAVTSIIAFLGLILFFVAAVLAPTLSITPTVLIAVLLIIVFVAIILSIILIVALVLAVGLAVVVATASPSSLPVVVPTTSLPVIVIVGACARLTICLCLLFFFVQINDSTVAALVAFNHRLPVLLVPVHLVTFAGGPVVSVVLAATAAPTATASALASWPQCVATVFAIVLAFLGLLIVVSSILEFRDLEVLLVDVLVVVVGMAFAGGVFLLVLWPAPFLSILSASATFAPFASAFMVIV